MKSEPIPPLRRALLADIAAAQHRVLLDERGELPLPVDIELLCDEEGLCIRRVAGDLYAHVERPNTTGAPLSGMLDFRNGEILVREDQVAGRQRFTIAHELAHYLIEDHVDLYAGTVRYTVEVDGSPVDIDITGQTDERADRIKQAEREADELAGMLLMPAACVDAAVAELGTSIPLLAARFGVSATAMQLNMSAYLPRIEWV